MCVRKKRRQTRDPWNEVIQRALCHTRRKERGGTRKHANAGIIPCNYVQHTTHEDETTAEHIAHTFGSGLFIFIQLSADEMEFNVLRRDNCPLQTDLSVDIDN